MTAADRGSFIVRKENQFTSSCGMIVLNIDYRRSPVIREETIQQYGRKKS